MTVQNSNIPGINRKAWQMMTPALTNSAAGSFIVTDKSGTTGNVLYVVNATTQYGYSCQEDAWITLPSFALAGTFGAGACGTYIQWSNTMTATGGTTTTLTTTAVVSRVAIGSKVRMLTGTAANIGSESTVTSINVTPSGTTTVTFSPAFPSAVVNTDTFAMNTGRFLVMNAGTIAAGIFKSFDVMSGALTSLGTTNLPATWGTDGRLVATPSSEGTFATGTATAGAASTLTNSAKAWTVNSWTNYQVRITAGTGKGQIRTIASNTATVLTVSSAWTTNPDATSQYAIEGNDDYVYLLGNNAVTMYRYSISGNTWTAMAPTTARAAAPIAGMSANWIGKTGNADWANENNIQDGRYIYSFRGGASTLDRFDIAGGTAGAGAWLNVVYAYANETFATGSAYDVIDNRIYIRKDATNRFFYFDVTGNNIFPFSTNIQTDGVALTGDKIFTFSYVNG